MCCKCGAESSRLCPGALGMALGVAKGLCMLLMSWVAWLTGYGAVMVEHISQFYHGYDASLMGGLIGGGYGLVGGFVFGIVLGILYNISMRYCHKKKDV